MLGDVNSRSLSSSTLMGGLAALAAQANPELGKLLGCNEVDPEMAAMQQELAELEATSCHAVFFRGRAPETCVPPPPPPHSQAEEAMKSPGNESMQETQRMSDSPAESSTLLESQAQATQPGSARTQQTPERPAPAVTAAEPNPGIKPAPALTAPDPKPGLKPAPALTAAEPKPSAVARGKGKGHGAPGTPIVRNLSKAFALAEAG